MSTTTIYLQSGTSKLTVFSDGSSYYTPPAIPCSLPYYLFVGNTPNGLTLDFETGLLTVTSTSI